MTAEQNFFHRWWETSTIGYELEAIWEMSVYKTVNSGAIALHRSGQIFWLLLLIVVPKGL